MTGLSTAVPQAIAGFLAVCHAAIDPDRTLGGAVPQNVGVFDGDPVEGQQVGAYVQVSGWDTTMREPATFGAPDFFTIEEQFDITGTVWAFVGQGAQAASRAQALLVFASVETALRSDPTLGGAVRAAWLNRHVGTQGVTAQGGTGTQIEWSCHCEARIP
jgi:hypothetical protein